MKLQRKITVISLLTLVALVVSILGYGFVTTSRNSDQFLKRAFKQMEKGTNLIGVKTHRLESGESFSVMLAHHC